uniref:VanWG n=1 Tax=Enterococcus faecalis TaxID=1351 RepID=Q9KHM0_ENTFL|nr:VanWG [Enterococcus faecalis]
MKFDGNRYAKKTSEKLLPNTVFETSSLMLNENSGFDMKYQINKVHNLKLAAKTINKVIIEPKETFSFWQLVRWADRHEKYKDGLNLVNGKIVGSYGGGLCQLSNMLFWLFLHTPLVIVERHGHAVESFPSTTEEMPRRNEATINEGWLDLKPRKKTNILSRLRLVLMTTLVWCNFVAKLVNIDIRFLFVCFLFQAREKVYQIASVCRTEKDKMTGSQTEKELYVNQCKIAYKLPDGVKIEERGV